MTTVVVAFLRTFFSLTTFLLSGVVVVVEREECVRLLISEGADVNLPDYGMSIGLFALVTRLTTVVQLVGYLCTMLP